MADEKFIVGTSGYSFADWVGNFYPAGTKQSQMFECYSRHFQAVELNFTFYAMPSQATIQRLVENSPPDFGFWVKANQQLTHGQDRSATAGFLDALSPMRETNKLLGVLLQFPQSFHRTIENRAFLADASEDFGEVPLAIEFRHRSWQHPSTVEGLRQRNLTLVVPDVPAIPDLYAPPATLTSRTGYLRLHSRDAAKWYAGRTERYDYLYSDAELKQLVQAWMELEQKTDRVYAMFNNCHAGRAAQNAEEFRKILGQI
jgi:uncharacterized protein YecE (DUF72 family)